MKVNIDKTIEIWANSALYFLLALYVLVLPFQGIFCFGSGATYMFKYALIGMMLVVIFVCYPYAIFLQDNFRLFLILLATCYGIWASVLTIFNGGDALGVAESICLSVLLIFSSILILILNYNEWNVRILKIFVCSCTIALLISWIFFVGRIRILLPPEFRHITPNRLYGVIKSPNATAYLAFCGLLAVVTLTAKRCIGIHLGRLLFIFFLVSFIFTFSKASFLGFMFVCIYFGFKGRSLFKRMFNPRDTVKYAMCVIIGVVLLYHFGGFSYRHSSTFNRNAVLDVLRIKEKIAQTGNRMHVWSYAVDIIADHWLFGIGPANWKAFFYSYGMDDEYDSPHNGFLEVLGGVGIFGLCYYLVLIFFIWQKSTVLEPLVRLSVRSLLVFTVARELVEVSTIFNCVINGMLFWVLICIFFSFHEPYEKTQISAIISDIWKRGSAGKGC